LKPISLVLVVAVSLLGVSACTRLSASIDQADDIEMSYTLSPAPARIGSAVIDVMLTSKDGPVEGATLSFRGDMAHAGMTPVRTAFREIDRGHYRAEIEWTMAGAWVLTIEGDLADGRTLQRQIDLEVSP